MSGVRYTSQAEGAPDQANAAPAAAKDGAADKSAATPLYLRARLARVRAGRAADGPPELQPSTEALPPLPLFLRSRAALYLQPKLHPNRSEEVHREPAPEPGAIRATKPGADPSMVDSGEVRSRLGAGSPMPGPIVQNFSHAYARDLSSVRVHADHTLAEQLGAKALTVGRDVVFARDEYRPGTPEGDRLIGHELAHVMQQAGGAGTMQGAGLSEDGYEREADHAADAALAGRRVSRFSAVGQPSDLTPMQKREAGAARIQFKRDPTAAPAGAGPGPAAAQTGTPPLTEAQTEMSQREAEIVRWLDLMPASDGTMFIGTMGGLVAAERHLPKAFPIIRERMIARHGQATFDGLYRNDDRVIRLVRSSASILGHLEALRDRYYEKNQLAAYDLITSYITGYELDYSQAVGLYAHHGDAFLAVYEMFLAGPAEVTADDLRSRAENAQVEHDEEEAQREAWAEVGRRAIGRTIATREILFWWDDTVTLQGIVEPAYGHETQAEAITWASISGRSCAVLSAERRYYVYELNHAYALSDVVQTGFHERTGIVPWYSGSGVVLVTNDGAVLTSKDGARYFAGSQTDRATEGLEGAARILERHGENLDDEQVLRLFRQMTRDLVFANLARSRKDLTRELDRFFMTPGVPMRAQVEPRAGEELKRDTDALRRHMMQAVTLADAMSEAPTEDDLDALREALAAVGRIHEGNPTAALMIQKNRDADAAGPAKEDDFKNRVAGETPGEAAWSGASEIGRRLSNIERVQQHLLENPDAVLDLTPLHPQVLQSFSPAQQSNIKVNLALRTLGHLAEAIGIAAGELAMVITATIVGGPVGFALTVASTTIGIRQTIGAFEQTSRLEAMTELGFTADTAIATPEMVSSARMWAYIGLGLTLIDVAGLAGSARSMACMRAVLSDPELARVLAFSRRSLGEAADALGVSERALVRDLHTLQGAERTQLLERIRTALEPRVSGGRYGSIGWDAEYTIEILTRMRRALLDDVGDVDRVTQALGRFGAPLDRATVATIKRYIFDSPGIAFSRQNYDAWLRLSSGQGTVSDVRFLFHEATETAELSRQGFNFLGEGWESMGRHTRTRWYREFGAQYQAAHKIAVAAEFDFVARQVSTLTRGRVNLSREVVASIDASLSGRQARKLMNVGDVVLEDHPRFYEWQSRAGEVVELDAAARKRLGDAIARGIPGVGGWHRAQAIQQGANPTLQELIALVKAMSIE